MESSKTNENINLKNNDLLMHINEELNQIIDYIQTNFDNNNIEMDFEKEELQIQNEKLGRKRKNINKTCEK